jgi:cell shape-determining protein MreC
MQHLFILIHHLIESYIQQLYSLTQDQARQIQILNQQLQAALTEIKVLKEEIQDLKDQLNTNSSNIPNHFLKILFEKNNQSVNQNASKELKKLIFVH